MNDHLCSNSWMRINKLKMVGLGFLVFLEILIKRISASIELYMIDLRQRNYLRIIVCFLPTYEISSKI